MPFLEKIKEFSDYFETWDIQNFQASEIMRAVDRPLNKVPPKSIWDNIMPTVAILDTLRNHLGSPITINSGYRSKEYNQSVGGVALSQHQAFTALDFHVRDFTPLEVRDVLKQWRDEEKLFSTNQKIKSKQRTVSAGAIPFDPIELIQIDDLWHFKLKGGIGTYRTFTHIDYRGRNAAWSGAGVTAGA